MRHLSLLLALPSFAPEDSLRARAVLGSPSLSVNNDANVYRLIQELSATNYGRLTTFPLKVKRKRFDNSPRIRLVRWV